MHTQGPYYFLAVTNLLDIVLIVGHGILFYIVVAKSTAVADLDLVDDQETDIRHADPGIVVLSRPTFPPPGPQDEIEGRVFLCLARNSRCSMLSAPRADYASISFIHDTMNQRAPTAVFNHSHSERG